MTTMFCRMRNLFLFACLSSVLINSGCHSGKKPAAQGQLTKDELRKQIDTVNAPVLSPSEALKHFVVQPGFHLQVAAAEPLVSAPVLMRFDNQGRMWVIEMNGYMPDTSGKVAPTPKGKIVILADTDHDGVMDSRKVFMDSLMMPRAICLFSDGILVADPPNLWFVENNHDSAGRKYLVDNGYAGPGNVEHQPNGLLRGLDNWIYNAKSAVRYRRVGRDKWIKEHTHFRGQWGITQDEFGRLYYNNNSANLIGDFLLPGLGGDNPHQHGVAGYVESIVPDTRVYPAHPTPGVNRGYMPGILDDSLRLVHFTAACGPVIFTSEAYGKDYFDNAFVAEPAGNLIKRDTLSFGDNTTSGKEAYRDQEFIASTDERFRPVDLEVGPDGALYVVDLYRGIIQHKAFLTPYLAGEVMKRGLEDPLTCGRVYRVVRDGNHPGTPVFSDNPDSLLSYLNSTNSWLRHAAHDDIVDKQLTGLAPALREMMTSGSTLIGRIQAMWVLEGLHRLDNRDIGKLLKGAPLREQQQIVAAAISLMRSKADAVYWLSQCSNLLDAAGTAMVPYVAYLAGAALPYDPPGAKQLLIRVAASHPADRLVSDAIISNLKDQETSFLTLYKKHVKDTSDAFMKRLEKVIQNAKQIKIAALARKRMNAFQLAGMRLFQTNCQVCHGVDGEGIRGLGAPLNGSNWVLGDKNTLLAIVLKGLSGPIKVGNKILAPPEVGGDMPAMANNDQLDDKDIAQIVSYIRNAWNNRKDDVTPGEVKNIRQKYQDRDQSFTMKELETLH